jgi:hypothetical protein
MIDMRCADGSGTIFPAPFIVGAPRSGTTLLRMMLDAHPALAIPPETGFVGTLTSPAYDSISRQAFLAHVTGSENWIDFQLPAHALAADLESLQPFSLAEAVRRFYRLYAARFDKSRWGDKTPDHGLVLTKISALLPEARFVHLIRDGRDVAVSLRNVKFAPSRSYADLAVYWSERVGTMRAQGRECANYLEMRYEALITQTEPVLRRICEFLELPFSGRMLRYYDQSPRRLQEHEGRIGPDGNVLITKEQRIAQQYRVTQPPDPSRIGAWRRS